MLYHQNILLDILFHFFLCATKIISTVIVQGGQVEGAKFVTWKTTQVCQVSLLASFWNPQGSGDSVPPPLSPSRG